MSKNPIRWIYRHLFEDCPHCGEPLAWYIDNRCTHCFRLLDEDYPGDS